MKPEKVRNLTADELGSQERELSDQLFKLKFQLNMGQTESLKRFAACAGTLRGSRPSRANAS